MSETPHAFTLETLHHWVEEQLQGNAYLGVEGRFQLLPLTGDAGQRRYYRLAGELSGRLASGRLPALLAVSAPVDAGLSDSAEYFAQLTKPLLGQGIDVPEVIALDAARNVMLIESFGSDSLLSQLNEESVEMLYGEALVALLKWQQTPREALSAQALPEYDSAALHAEMALFPEWFVEKLLGYALSDKDQAMLKQAFDFLIDEALAQPQVLVHRDYHSRNLMYRQGDSLGIIDFQDAVWGPLTYDVVSLLRDCYIRWPLEHVIRWAVTYGNMAIEVGLLPVTSKDQYLRWFNTMGLQRHIKVLGIFARLYLRDGKPGYLDDLPLVLRYTLEVAELYRETQPLAQFIRTQLLPLIETQPWYSPIEQAGEREVML